MIQKTNRYADRHALIRSLPRVPDLPPRVPERRTHSSAILAFPGHCEYACAIEIYRRDRSYEIAGVIGAVCVAAIAYFWPIFG